MENEGFQIGHLKQTIISLRVELEELKNKINRDSADQWEYISQIKLNHSSPQIGEY